ncbi:hypothetical protein ARH93_05420 [Listeria monocytogenes]|uniref:hypothetical protein n=1 Tax=Listeria monocytogenes TaxID=1639 RepID=UPI00099556D1|nr:hypothetical protein [Listeria monocytogenes]EAC4638184.1 hypothetical protein [Listeria monocytogenes]EAC5934147.1 hypothetical protein [Listeria monocytogenes]EAC9089499.1 hypothetical protein [Listeria monocytogenes]EAD0743757.1 hypothetical protein [Listeria monocytogenes]EAD5935099.1 hypothetical protein [Listeria monocytogenes]
MKNFLYIFRDIKELNDFVDKVIKEKGDLITKDYAGWRFELGNEIWHLRVSHAANVFAKELRLDGFLFSDTTKSFLIESGRYDKKFSELKANYLNHKIKE